MGAALAAALALGALGAAWGAARNAADAHERASLGRVTADARHLQTTLQQAGLAVGALADGAAGDGVPAFRSEAPAIVGESALRLVALATKGDGGRYVIDTVVPAPSGPLARGAAPAPDDLVQAAVAEVAPVLGLGPDEEILAVAPVVRAGADEPVGVRRGATDAVVVGLVDLDPIVDEMFDGADVELFADERSVYRRGRAAGDLLAGSVRIGSGPWRIAVDVPPRSVGVVPLAIVGIGLALALAAGTALASALARRRASEEVAADRTRQLARIAETGGHVQQSLDLGELLPGFAIALADEYDLLHVSISLVDDEGRLVEAFATGDPRGGQEPFVLQLRRGWRSVGALAVRPRRPLDESEKTSLQALGDLLAVALSNAQLLQREQEAAGRLRELDALENVFLGTVSHELRTSMTAIMGFSELLVDAWDDLGEDRRRELSERVRRSAGSLRHLVDDLLDFARLEQQQVRLSPRPLDLGDAARHTVEALRSLLAEHRLDLQVDSGVTAYVDPIAIERIVANLVSNAAKYAPAGTTVTVAVRRVGGGARLVVSDQGPGIPAADRARIFVRFYRLDTEATLRTRGAGIGLSILREFVDRSGALIAVDDAPGGGARFTIDFPETPPAPSDDPAAAGRSLS